MIVHCKECKHNEDGNCVHPKNTPRIYLGEEGMYEYYLEVSDEHYCSYGERNRNG